MRKWIAVAACFGVPALVAACVALAPFGGTLAPLDAGAAWIMGVLGREVAVLALLGLGVLLALLAIATQSRRAAAAQIDMPKLSPAWTPGPLPYEPPAPEPQDKAPDDTRSQDRIANLRRRALPDEDSRDDATAPAPPRPVSSAIPSAVSSALPPPPVILIRKPRERTRDWFADGSWLGGLPRLGPAAWPRDTQGSALPFVAQIDLGELAAACPGTPLPRAGSLAFFLGTGAVVAVPEGAHDFTDPPADLPPAFDEGGSPFPATPTRLSRWFFPFWPVEPIVLDLPDHLRDNHNPLRETAIEGAMATRLAAHATLRDHPFYAAGVGAPVDVLWWHSVIHLADQLHEALAACARPLAIQRTALDQKQAAFAQLQADTLAAPDAAAHAEQAAVYLAAELAMLEEQCAALPAMVAAIDGFVSGRDPWTALTAEERDVVGDILADIHERFGELVRFHAPGSLAQLATLSLRAMVSGPPEVLAALPDDMLERINRDYRLPPIDQHQMFGLPASRRARRDRTRHDSRDGGEAMLLLQLGYDDMMEWCWNEAGLFQFWIDEADAAAGNWNAATLTFESE